jgi:hypothetical protein
LVGSLVPLKPLTVKTLKTSAAFLVEPPIFVAKMPSVFGGVYIPIVFHGFQHPLETNIPMFFIAEEAIPS